MILTITQRGGDPDELGYLLHKHPQRVHEFDLKFGKATVFYPEVSKEACTAALVVEIDPIGLVRSKGARQGGWALGQYVNDRPYVASSFLSVAISRVFGTALNGRCNKRPGWVDLDRDLEIRLPVVAAPGGQEMLERLFSPLGYGVASTSIALDPKFPAWGDSRYVSLTLKTRQALHRVLKHLFVIVPALDRAKHYWIGQDEIEKLLQKGEGWLANHPEQEWIVKRYLRYQRRFTTEALERLNPPEEAEESEEASGTGESAERETLHTVRLDRVTEVAMKANPASMIDLGCGEGKLLHRLLKRTHIPRITGMDVDSRSLEMAKERLERRLPPAKREGRLKLLHGSLIYRDDRLAGYEMATLVEVIEHLDPGRLKALERVVFEFAAPDRVIVSTPNREYNTLFEGMTEGQLRHADHRFEWSRKEFADWCAAVGAEHSYEFEIEPLGEEDPVHGAPSQMAVFVRGDVREVEEEEVAV